MKTPPWLKELYHQWQITRGKSLTIRSRPFARDWDKLLSEAGIITSEEIAMSVIEAERLEISGRLKLTPHRYRPKIILRISLPLHCEQWLFEIFNHRPVQTLLQESLKHIQIAKNWHHPRFKKSWGRWLQHLESEFSEGRNVRAAKWRQPGTVEKLLKLTFQITSREWEKETLIREASDTLGLSSKNLEKSMRALESCFEAMFGQPTSFGMLNIVTSQSRIEVAGDLCLHFPDGTLHRIDGLESTYQLTSDLDRAISVSTPAARILLVENSKTTLRRLTSFNRAKNTLLVACSFPGQGVVKLMNLLPVDLPVYHFGDTDPAGFLILSKIRQKIGLRVKPFLMKYRRSDTNSPLTDYDKAILPNLLTDPFLEDVKNEISQFISYGCKGKFEQESLGRADLEGWPFYSQAQRIDF